MPYNKDSGTLDLSGNLPEMVKKIEANWPVLPSGTWNGSSIQSLRHYLRELSRRSERAGLETLRELARLIDEKVQSIVVNGAPPNSDRIGALNESLGRLKQAIGNLHWPTTSPGGETQSFDLLFLHRNQNARERIEKAVAQREWRYRTLSNLLELRNTLDKGAKTILIDTSFLPELNQQLPGLYPRRHAQPGLFFVSDRCDIETRMQAIRAGAMKLFSEPIDLEALVKALEEHIHPKTKPRHKILIVEDDESQARLAADLLRKGAFETLTLTDPLRVIDTIWRFQPDLILMMDLYMTDADGIILTKLIRDREESAAIPIVFLSGEEAPEKKLQALQAGADDFLTMPIQLQQLLATVRNRIQRAKAISAAGIHKRGGAPNELPARKALLSRIELAYRGLEEGGWFHGVIVIALDAPQADPVPRREADADRIIGAVVEGLGPLLQGKDYLARIGYRCLATLVRRPSRREVERLADLAYEIVNYRLTIFAEPEKRLGIGLTMLDGTTQNSDILLQQGESAANTAYQKGLKGYSLYQKGAPHPGARVSGGTAWRREQFLHSLQTGSATLQERRFICRKAKEQATDVLELIPQSVAPGAPDNLYQTAALCGAAAEFDHFVCDLGIQRLGEYTLQGKPVRLILRQSAAVMEESDYLDFIKTVLRRLQIVGTGLMMEFELPALASDLQRARALFDELAALGIGISLSHFPCNESSYRALTYLRADAVRPRPSLLQVGAERIEQISRQIRSMQTEIILPRVEHLGQIAHQWSESADYIQADVQT